MDWNNLLQYFKQEKNFLRKMAEGFSIKYPKVAGFLDFGGHESTDPQLERLVESVTFLSSVIQKKMDGDFPEITTGLLGLIYPNMINPIPSMSIAQFDASGDIEEGSAPCFPAGTILSAPTEEGKICKFRTNYPVEHLPIEVTHVSIDPATRYEFLRNRGNVSNLVRISIEVLGDHTPESLSLDKIRFFLNGDPMHISDLYEALFCNLQGIVILPESKESAAITLNAENLQSVGFSPEEVMLPGSETSTLAYHLVQEYFCFPEKFHFIDIKNLGGLLGQHKKFDILLLLNANPKVDIDEKTFLPGCTPIINLFETYLPAVQLEPDQNEYLLTRLIDETTVEVHSLLEVFASEEGQVKGQKIHPFYQFRHEIEDHSEEPFWLTRREMSYDTAGTDLFISFRDLNQEVSEPEYKKVYITALCTNRDLAAKLPVNAQLRLSEDSNTQIVRCVKKPTAPVQPPLGGRTLWNLVSNLAVNHLSISEGENSLKALKEMLACYNLANQNSNERQLNGIHEMNCKSIIRHAGQDGWRGFTRGLELELRMNKDFYVGNSALLFSMVLRHFFSLYVSAHSFCETVVYKTTEPDQEWKRFEAITGIRPIL